MDKHEDNHANFKTKRVDVIDIEDSENDEDNENIPRLIQRPCDDAVAMMNMMTNQKMIILMKNRMQIKMIRTLHRHP